MANTKKNNFLKTEKRNYSTPEDRPADDRLKPLHEAFGTSDWAGLTKAIAKLDKRAGKEIAAKNAITDEQITFLLDKKKNGSYLFNLFKKAGERVVEKVTDKMADKLDKNLTVQNGDNSLTLGSNNSPPAQGNKIPAGVWIALALVVLIALIFLIVKFGFKR